MTSRDLLDLIVDEEEDGEDLIVEEDEAVGEVGAGVVAVVVGDVALEDDERYQ